MAIRYPYRIGEFITIEQIKRMNADAGQYWFTPDTMRFFASRVAYDVFPHPLGWLFISSERYKGSQGDGPRRYTVRLCKPDGHIETINTAGGVGAIEGADGARKDGFMAYATGKTAKLKARVFAGDAWDRRREIIATIQDDLNALAERDTGYHDEIIAEHPDLAVALLQEGHPFWLDEPTVKALARRLENILEPA